MADPIILPALAFAYSAIEPSNTSVYWYDESINSPIFGAHVKVFNPQTQVWQLAGLGIGGNIPTGVFIPYTEKGVANGVAELNNNGLVPTSQLGSGFASNTRFLRGDGTWVVISGVSQTLADTLGFGNIVENGQFFQNELGTTKQYFYDDGTNIEIDSASIFSLTNSNSYLRGKNNTDGFDVYDITSDSYSKVFSSRLLKLESPLINIGVASSQSAQLQFLNSTNNFGVSFQSGVTANNIKYILPITDPTGGQVLSATLPVAGVSTLSWETASAGFSTLAALLADNPGTSNTTGGTPLIISNTDIVKSEDGLIQMDFGSGGYWQIATDGTGLNTGQIYVDQTQFFVGSGNGKASVTGNATTASIGFNGKGFTITDTNTQLSGPLFTVLVDDIILGDAVAYEPKFTWKNNSNANTVTLKTGVTTTSYDWILPVEPATGVQALIDTGGGALGWSDLLTPSTAASTYVAKAGDTMTGDLLFISGEGLDTTATGGSDVLNIGATNANVINYGNSSTVHNFLGTAIYELQVNSYVTDKLMTLNYGGAAASGIGVGLEVEENNIITGYQKTNAARSGWSFKAPANTDYTDIIFSATVPRTKTFQDTTSTIAEYGNNLSVFAATTSAQLRGIISDENGTGALLFNNATSPIFVTDITSPMLIGGTADASKLTFKGSTSATVFTNSPTTLAYDFMTGNSAATQTIGVYNDGQVLLGTTTRIDNALGIFRIAQGTAIIDAGQVSSNIAGLWMGTTGQTNSTTNYTLKASSTTTTLNGGVVNISTNNSTKLAVSSGQFNFTPSATSSGATNPFMFTLPLSTNQTAGTEVSSWDFDGATNSIQHASNTLIPTQRDYYWRGRPHRFASATGTITDCYSAYIDAPTASTNCIITNAWALGVNGNANLLAKTKFGTGVLNDGGGLKHARVTTGSVAGGSTALVTITWTTAFADANYTVTADVLEATTSSLSMSVVHIESVTASAVTVRVLNNAIGALTGTIQCIAIHD